MVFKLLVCEVLTREIGVCLARTPHTIRPVFTNKGEHNEPEMLRRKLQAEIDGAAGEDLAYDAILLAYGLCGNATLGLAAREIPLVLPRAHDCTALFLGSKERFRQYFEANPSKEWASVGYAERSGGALAGPDARKWLSGGMSHEALVAQYGEENAQYILDALGPKHNDGEIYFVDVPETRIPGAIARIKEEAAAQSRTVTELPGSIRLIEMLLSGDWPEDEFLVVPPGHGIAGVYDYDQVVTAEPVDGE